MSDNTVTKWVGWVWFAAALPGCWLGIKLRPLFGLSRE